MDPFEFRRKNIGDSRWLGVLEAAAKAAGWSPRPSASRLSDTEVVTGRGIAVGKHHVPYGAAATAEMHSGDLGRRSGKHQNILVITVPMARRHRAEAARNAAHRIPTQSISTSNGPGQEGTFM